MTRSRGPVTSECYRAEKPNKGGMIQQPVACGEQVFSPATCTCKSITTESEYVPQGGNWRTAAAERERGALKLLVTSLCF